MEVKGGWENKFKVLLFELIGTANLLFAVNSSANNKMLGIPLQPFAAGMTIFGNICILG